MKDLDPIQVKDDITTMCFLNNQWFGRLRDIIADCGELDQLTLDFINNCQDENRAMFEKYKG